MKRFFNFFRLSFRAQLIYGIGLFLAALLSVFIYMETTESNNDIRERGMLAASDHSMALASMTKVWVMSNDYIGLEEALENFAVYHDLVFATVINLDGKVIAHTDKSMVGKYVSDKRRVSFLRKIHRDKDHDFELFRNGYNIDVLRVIHNGDKHIGFVHLRFDQQARLELIRQKTFYQIGFGLLYVASTILLLYFLVNMFSKQLGSLLEVIKKVHDGDKTVKANDEGYNELSRLSQEFNRMLAAISTGESNLNEIKERLEYAVKGSNDGLWDWNIEAHEVYFSPRWKEMLGYADSELPNEFITWEERLHPDDLEQAKSDIVACHTNPEILYSNIHRMRHKDGHWVWILARAQTIFDTQGKANRMVGFHTDITKQKELEQRLEEQNEVLRRAEEKYIIKQEQLNFQANHDALTGLANRLLFNDRLEQVIQNAKRNNSKVALLFIDLDHFKEINDSLGHDIGDEVLKEVTSRVKSTVRAEDTIARLGGDEFTIILENLTQAQDSATTASKILNVLSKAMNINNNVLHVSSSIGISIYPDDGASAQDLLKFADSAMYKAKDEGRNNFQYYDSRMTELAFERVVMEASLRAALINNEFVVHYQPQVNGTTDTLIGMEALVRWQHPIMGLVSPAKFIPLAESTGLIVELDRMVMKIAMTQVSQWHKEGLSPGILAMNLAVKQLQKEDFIPILKELMKETNCKPEWIELEVTEGQIMTHPEEAIVKLKEISDLGIELAVDDFGTGYSSLAYLKRLPIDKLKIDQAFVRDLPDDEEDAGIAKAVIALAKSLNLKVIAEGVETKEQRDFLVENGCEDIQGYFYSKPIPANELEELLKSHLQIST